MSGQFEGGASPSIAQSPSPTTTPTTTPTSDPSSTLIPTTEIPLPPPSLVIPAHSLHGSDTHSQSEGLPEGPVESSPDPDSFSDSYTHISSSSSHEPPIPELLGDPEVGEERGPEDRGVKGDAEGRVGTLLASLEQIGRREEEESEEEFQLPRRNDDSGFSVNKCILGAVILLGLGTIFLSGRLCFAWLIEKLHSDVLAHCSLGKSDFSLPVMWNLALRLTQEEELNAARGRAAEGAQEQLRGSQEEEEEEEEEEEVEVVEEENGTLKKELAILPMLQRGWRALQHSPVPENQWKRGKEEKEGKKGKDERKDRKEEREWKKGKSEKLDNDREKESRGREEKKYGTGSKEHGKRTQEKEDWRGEKEWKKGKDAYKESSKEWKEKKEGREKGEQKDWKKDINRRSKDDKDQRREKQGREERRSGEGGEERRPWEGKEERRRGEGKEARRPWEGKEERRHGEKRERKDVDGKQDRKKNSGRVEDVDHKKQEQHRHNQHHEESLWQAPGDGRPTHTRRRPSFGQPDYWVHQRQRLRQNRLPSRHCASVEECARFEGTLPVQLTEFEALLEGYLTKAEQGAGVDTSAGEEIRTLAAEFFKDGVFVHDQMSFRDYLEDLADILEDMVDGDDSEEDQEEDDSDLEDEMEMFGKEVMKKFAERLLPAPVQQVHS
uniref:Pre-B-cell leukemia transcription factor-interacting protein 1 n=1 Tax=Gadus morhua TaxID=8049 RepID=A0A8C5AEY6_GADMO